MRNFQVVAAILAVALVGTAAQAQSYYTQASAYAAADNGQTQPPVLRQAAARTQQEAQRKFDYSDRYATSSVYADLSSGKLGIAVDSQQYSGAGVGYGEFADQLFFSVAGADADELTQISVKISFHGVYGFHDGSPANALLNAGLYVVFGGAYGPPQMSMGHYQFADGSQYGFASTASSFVSSSVEDLGDTHIFTGSFNLKGATSTIDLMARMHAAAYNGAFGDFSNTASISFDLPTNVTFSSVSGVFLTADNAVPEPATWAMMIAGFGLVGGAMRRRTAPAPVIT